MRVASRGRGEVRVWRAAGNEGLAVATCQSGVRVVLLVDRWDLNLTTARALGKSCGARITPAPRHIAALRLVASLHLILLLGLAEDEGEVKIKVEGRGKAEVQAKARAKAEAEASAEAKAKAKEIEKAKAKSS